MTQFAAGRGRLLLAIVVGILAADRATKILADRWLTMGDPVPVIPGFFQFTLVYNTGMAFGLLDGIRFAGKAWLLTGVSAGLLALVLWFVVRSTPLTTRTAVGIAAVVAGAVGNMADRLLYGHVVDFLDAYIGSAHWPAFNIADAMICTGVGLVLLENFAELRRGEAQADSGG